MVGFYAYVIDR